MTTMHFSRLGGLLVLALTCGVLPAATIELTAVADNFQVSILPTSSFGAAGAFGLAAPGLPKGEFHSLVRFDLAAARTNFDATYGVGGWTLQSAALRLTATTPNNSIFNGSGSTPQNNAGNFQVKLMQAANANWTEGGGTPAAPLIPASAAAGISWNFLPSVLTGSDPLLGTFSFDGANSGTFSYALNLDTLLLSELQTGGLASMHLSAAPGDTTIAALFNSRSFGTVSSRPQLTLTAQAIPEPGFIGLGFLIGVAGLCWKQARRRRATTTSELMY